MRFVVHPTSDYTDRSAGISALHRLCHWLNVLGFDASLTAAGLNPDWETKTWDGQMTLDTVAIYPEVVRGNPLAAPKVVRWALSNPGYHYFGSPSIFDPCDLAFYYAERFQEATQRAYTTGQAQRLFVSVYPPDMFFPMVGPKMHDMYYIGRGGNCWDAFRDRVDLSHAVQFPGGYPNRYELGKALRRVDRFFMFDQVGALLAESMLCGAKPVLIREDGAIIECTPAGLECMGVFGSHARYDKPGDVEGLVTMCAKLFD